MKKLTAITVAAMLLGGCQGTFGDDGGQSGEDMIVCRAVETVDLADGEASTLGFGSTEVEALAGGTHTGTLAYEGGGTTELTLALTLSAPRFLDQEWVDDNTGDGGAEPALAGDCPDVVAMDAEVALSTTDGAFDEVFEVRLDAESAELAYFFHELDLTALGGTFEVPGAADYDSVRAFVDGTFDGTGSHGEISGQGESVDGDVASATMIPVGTW